MKTLESQFNNGIVHVLRHMLNCGHGLGIHLHSDLGIK